MWLSKDMHGNVEQWEYKPKINEFDGCFYGEGQSFFIGKKTKLGIKIRKGECKKVGVSFSEVKK